MQRRFRDWATERQKAVIIEDDYDAEYRYGTAIRFVPCRALRQSGWCTWAQPARCSHQLFASPGSWYRLISLPTSLARKLQADRGLPISGPARVCTVPGVWCVRSPPATDPSDLPAETRCSDGRAPHAVAPPAFSGRRGGTASDDRTRQRRRRASRARGGGPSIHPCLWPQHLSRPAPRCIVGLVVGYGGLPESSMREAVRHLAEALAECGEPRPSGSGVISGPDTPHRA